MTNPTRKQIIDAHEALGELRGLAESSPPRHDPQAEALEHRILAVLPPKPRPTMADVEWDDNVHYLSEAEHAKWGKVVMIYLDSFGTIRCAVKGDLYFAAREDLTPTGRRCTLTEVQDD